MIEDQIKADEQLYEETKEAIEDLIKKYRMNYTIAITSTVNPSLLPAYNKFPINLVLKNFEGLVSRLLKNKVWVKDYIMVLEPVFDKNSRIINVHYHGVIGITKNLKRPKGKFYSPEQFQMHYRYVPACLTVFHDELRNESPNYGFGSHHAYPIWSTQKRYTRYILKYLYECSYKRPWGRHKELRNVQLVKIWNREMDPFIWAPKIWD